MLRSGFMKVALVIVVIALLALGSLANNARAGNSAQETPTDVATEVTATPDVSATLEVTATVEVTAETSGGTGGSSNPAATPDMAATVVDIGGPFPPCPEVIPNPFATMEAGDVAAVPPAATMDMGMATPEMSMTADAGMGAMTPEPTMEVGTFAQGEGCVFATELSGENEVPSPGDPDADGTAIVTISRPESGQGMVCFQINVTGITLPAGAAHIHRAIEGQAGPVVVPLSAPDASGVATGCTTNVNRELLNDIASKPWNFYVNVHTSDFPAGAARGQLQSAADMEPTTTP
jgi:hypothetical protein